MSITAIKHLIIVALLAASQTTLLWLDTPSWISVLIISVLALAYLTFGQTAQTHKIETPSNSRSESTTKPSIISDATSRLAIGAAEVSFFMDGLIKDIKVSVDESEQIVSASQELTTTSSHLTENLQTINQTITKTATATQQADALLVSGVDNISELATSVKNASEQLQLLRDSADNIQRITEVINSVADQTNLLALNAAIEAARAGEQGRGFAVVADEVRALAGKTSGATKDIAQMLAEIREQSQHTGNLMAILEQSSEQVQQQLQQVAVGFNGINQDISGASNALEQIEQASNGLQSTSEQINRAITTISGSLQAIEHKGVSVAEQAISLSGETESIYLELSHGNEHIFFSDVLKEAQQAAAAIGKLFEQAIDKGTFSREQLFAERYELIPNTTPPKYHTAYDDFTDQQLPAIQEPILTKHANVLYAGTVDRKGYFPTHNKIYSQPLTGNIEKDLLNNRTKRIFDDRTGSRCGSNTSPMLLQTYKRDTGEVLHDLSVPVLVFGQHFGGFRIGFKRQ